MRALGDGQQCPHQHTSHARVEGCAGGCKDVDGTRADRCAPLFPGPQNVCQVKLLMIGLLDVCAVLDRFMS
jgi:hypothetical protein